MIIEKQKKGENTEDMESFVHELFNEHGTLTFFVTRFCDLMDREPLCGYRMTFRASGWTF